MAGIAVLLSMASLVFGYYLLTLYKKGQERLASENLHMIEGFLAQLEEENQRLLRELRALHEAESQQQQEFAHWISQVRQEIRSCQGSIESAALGAEPVASLSVNATVSHIQSLASEILRLKEEGYDVAQIARRLHRGRGEVELILSLASLPEKG